MRLGFRNVSKRCALQDVIIKHNTAYVCCKLQSVEIEDIVAFALRQNKPMKTTFKMLAYYYLFMMSLFHYSFNDS